MIPSVLRSIADTIAGTPRVAVRGTWEADCNGRWHIPIVADLAVAPSEHMPARTAWRLVIGPNQPADGVFIYPDAEGGILDTFRHQDWNLDPAEGASWRRGKPCLERPINGLGRDEWGDEPRELEAAALWKVGRLLQWIDAAASDTLVPPGSANELPAGVGMGAKLTLGFLEKAEDLVWSATTGTRWGFASLATVPGAANTWALAELLDERSDKVREFNWGTMLAAAPTTINTVWLLANSIPVRAPWNAPTTWCELRDDLSRQGVNLTAIIVQAGARYRAGARRTASHRLIIGFPYQSRVGDPPERIHWLCVGSLPLAGRTEKRDGFRPREESRRLWDRQLAGSNNGLVWLKAENWAPDQLQSRGGVERPVSDSRILLIGAGSLGGAVADNLVRAGVLQIGVFDGGTLEAGNLVRHVLSMADVGHNKSDALVRKLNGVSPNARLQSFPHEFAAGMTDASAQAARSYDVIVDCTGSDDLLDELAAFEWQEEKVFVSLSMTWGAEGLLAFCAKEVTFPTIDAKDRFANAGAPPVRHGDANVEAIGCWHPVFPADADDVQQWAALGSKFIRAAIIDPTRRLRYHRRTPGGGTEIVDG